jgi:hypothetical protein
MEIHAPEKPIHSWREFAIHLGTVTVGILIALALDGAVEWNHHRHLVREARENLASEIAHNRDQVGNFLAKVKDTEQDYEALTAIVSRVRAVKSERPSYQFRAYTMQLDEAAWTTAQASGAVSYMDYAEIQRYAEVYALQSRLAAAQQKFFDTALAATPDADPSAWSEGRFENWKQLVAETDVRARAEEHVATALAEKLDQIRRAGAEK